MSYAKYFFSRMHSDLHRYPPLIVFRKLHAICIELDAMDAFDIQALEQIIICLTAIILRLPDQFRVTSKEFIADGQRWMADEEAYNQGPTVPLHDLVPVAECILLIHSFFCDGPIRDLGLFAQMRRQLFLNQASYHRMSVVDVQRGKAPLVTDAKETPEELIDRFLGGTPFYHLFQIQVPFRIPREAFTRHGFVLAPTGFGKSQLLGSMIAQFLSQDDSPGMFVLDPHGNEEKSLFNLLRQRVPASRLAIIDVDEDPPVLNFLAMSQGTTEVQALQTFNFLMSSLSGEMSDKQGAIVPYLLKLLRKIPEASLETLRLIVDEKVKDINKSQFAHFIQALPQVEQGFFHNQFYTSSMDDTKKAIGWKLYAAIHSEVFRHMFCSPGGASINFDRLIAERKVVLVRASKDTLGADGQSVFFQYIIAQYFAAGLRRGRIPERERHLNILFGDEASVWLSSPIIASICFELRKYRCGLWQGTQVYDQIGESVRAAILGSVGTKICGPVQSSDANTLANEMYTTGAFIRSMKAKERSHADWAIYVSGMTDKAAKVRVPYGALEAMPRLNSPGRPSSLMSAAVHAPSASQMHKETYVNQAPQGLNKTHEAPDGASHYVMQRDAEDAAQSTDDEQQRGGTRVPEPLIKPGKHWD